jgi:hypothetical protein
VCLFKARKMTDNGKKPARYKLVMPVSRIL